MSRDYQLIRRQHINNFPHFSVLHEMVAAWLADTEETMKIQSYWTNKKARLFLMPKEGPPIYTGWAVFRVFWKLPDRPRVIVSGYMQNALNHDIIGFTGGTLHVVCRDSGDPKEYYEDSVIAKFIGCRVGRGWIPKMVAARASDDGYGLCVFLELECGELHLTNQTKEELKDA